MKKLLVLSVAVILLAGGCQKDSVAPSTGSTGSTPTKEFKNTQTASAKPSFVPVEKDCAIPPPNLGYATTTNAAGKIIDTKQEKIFTSRQAIPQLWAEAKRWASDARLALGFSGSGQAFTPTDPSYRAHPGQARGAMWAWSATFYSPSKNENIYLAYIDERAGGSIPQQMDEQTAKAYAENTTLYQDVSEMIDSCQAYEIAKQNGLDDKNNYYLIMTGDHRSLQKYPDRQTWVVEERSRTDTDNGKEVMGKVVQTYLIDGQTGEFLEKREGRVYSF